MTLINGSNSHGFVDWNHQYGIAERYHLGGSINAVYRKTERAGRDASHQMSDSSDPSRRMMPSTDHAITLSKFGGVSRLQADCSGWDLVAAVCTENLNPDVVVMKSAKDRV